MEYWIWLNQWFISEIFKTNHPKLIYFFFQENMIKEEYRKLRKKDISLIPTLFSSSCSCRSAGTISRTGVTRHAFFSSIHSCRFWTSFSYNFWAVIHLSLMCWEFFGKKWKFWPPKKNIPLTLTYTEQNLFWTLVEVERCAWFSTREGKNDNMRTYKHVEIKNNPIFQQWWFYQR